MRSLGFTQQQGPVLDALGVAVEGAPRPPEPRLRHRGTRADGMVLPQPHRALSGPALIAELVVGAVRALARRDAFVETAEPPRGFGHEIGPLRLELP